MVVLILTLTNVLFLFYALGLRSDRNNWRNLAERYRKDFIRVARDQPYVEESIDYLGLDENGDEYEEFENDNIVEFPKGGRRDN